MKFSELLREYLNERDLQNSDYYVPGSDAKYLGQQTMTECLSLMDEIIDRIEALDQ